MISVCRANLLVATRIPLKSYKRGKQKWLENARAIEYYRCVFWLACGLQTANSIIHTQSRSCERHHVLIKVCVNISPYCHSHFPRACMFAHTQTLLICKSYDHPSNWCCLSDVVWVVLFPLSKCSLQGWDEYMKPEYEYSSKHEHEHEFCKNGWVRVRVNELLCGYEYENLLSKVHN